jgi:hypothetical protein
MATKKECPEMSQNVHLTPKQHRAIVALLTTPALSAAAEKAGVCSKTLTRWMGEPAFLAELKDKQSEVIDQASVRLVGGLEIALNTLVRLMLSAESESVRRAAASEWLDKCLTLREQTDIERRLAILEKDVKK